LASAPSDGIFSFEIVRCRVIIVLAVGANQHDAIVVMSPSPTALRGYDAISGRAVPPQISTSS
jgi:hypothetical protein